jgi:hypothetical protein
LLENWEIHKESHVILHSWSIVEGILFLACYVAVGLVLPIALPYVLDPRVPSDSWLKRLCNGLQSFYERRGPTIYAIEMLLLLGMIGIPIKMVLRLFFNVKYILTIPAIQLNL